MNNISILVLGAGELGLAVLRSLAKRVALFPSTTLTVLLRPSTITSHDPERRLEQEAGEHTGRDDDPFCAVLRS